MELYCYRGPATVFWDPLGPPASGDPGVVCQGARPASVTAVSAYQEETRYEQMPNLKEMKTKPEKKRERHRPP
jgi:hypothetical protein